MADVKLTLVVACALVDADKRVLIAQRPPGKALAGLWEFPGGKIEPGERPEATLIRELHEEIGISVSEACLAPLTFASHAYDTFHLLMPLYICRRWEGEVIAREGQTLAWVRANGIEGVTQDAPRRRLLLVHCGERRVLLLTGGAQDVVVGWLDPPTENPEVPR